MSYSLDSDIQEDLRTFPMYQRLRKINPYAYYSLNTQKQMQLDLRTLGSPNFFMVDPDTIPEGAALAVCSLTVLYGYLLKLGTMILD